MRFSIRDLLWLTTVMALSLGWGLDGTRKERKIHDLEEKLTDLSFKHHNLVEYSRGFDRMPQWYKDYIYYRSLK